MQRYRQSMYNRSIQRMAVLACGGLLLALAGPASAVTSSGAAATAAGAPAYFHTVPPGTKLPTGGQCAKWVRARPMKENKGVNRTYNRTTGQRVSKTFFSGDKSQANQWIAPRINGNFTGTTAEILRWAACKWGIDQNMV